MKKTYILAAGMLCLMATACTKDVKTIGAFNLNDIAFNDNDTKMHLSYHSDLSAVSYDSGEDKIYVNGEEYTVYQRGSGTGTWTAEGTASVTAEDFYSLYVDGSMTYFSGTTYRYNMTSNLSGTTGIVLSGHTTNANLTMTPACAILRVPLGATGFTVKVGFENNKVPVEGVIDASTGKITAGYTYLTGVSQPATGVYAGQFLTMHEDASNNYYVGVPIEGNAVTTYLYLEWSYGGGTPTRYRTSGQVTLQPGYVYTLGTSRVSPFNTDGSGIGMFDVSADLSVAFSKSNLMYQARPNYYFFFADNQYVAMHQSNANIGRNYSGKIDLFGWGTSGEGTYYPYLSTKDKTSYYSASNLDGTNYDWGSKDIFLSESSSTASSASWRTLTSVEWKYLLTHSTCGMATLNINGTVYYGMLLCPTFVPNPSTGRYVAWTCPDGVSVTSGWANGFNTNVYNSTQWTLLENSGVIFLPTTGYRQQTAIYDYNVGGYYWSTTNSTGSYALGYSFGDDDEDPWGDAIDQQLRSAGLAVRLVKNL